MSKALDDLKKAMEAEEKSIKERTNGAAATYGDGGPVTISIIRALVAAFEAQAKEIEQLKSKLK